MSLDQAVDLVRETLYTMLLVSSPVLAAALVIGLIISLFQAVTQIQEQTLSFAPKIIGMVIVAIVVAPWMGAKLLEFAARMFAGR